MMLSHLPSDLLGFILGESDSSYLVLDLWICGDKLLNAKMASSVTYIELELHPCHFGNYPRMLSEFRSLRYLSLKSSYDLMKNVADWRLELSKLSDGLETLRLESPDARCAFLNFAPDWSLDSPSFIQTQYPRGRSSFMDIESKFPKLHTLHLVSEGDILADDLAGLPSTLTVLSTSYIIISTGTSSKIDQLPPSLLKLDADIDIEEGCLEGAYLEAWSRAPPQLESIRKITWFDSINTTSWLPTSLTECTIAHGHMIPHLPLSLNSITLSSFDTSYSNISLSSWASLLPSHLTRLTLDPSNDESLFSLGANIRQLPETLTSLSLPHRSFGGSLIDWSEVRQESIAPGADNLWPPRLKELRLGGHTVRAKDVSLLPTTLTSLEIAIGDYQGAATRYGIGQIDKHFLPSQLTSLQLTARWAKSALESLSVPLHFPSTITNLEIEEWHVNWFAAIPRSTSSLLIKRLHGVHRSSLTARDDVFKELPSALKCLAIDRLDGPPAELLFGGAAFSTQSFASLPSLSELRVVNIGSFPAKVLRSLPRGMLTLHIELDSLNKEDAPFIPSRLKSFLLLGSDISWRMPHIAEHWPLRSVSKKHTPSRVYANLAAKFPALQVN